MVNQAKSEQVNYQLITNKMMEGNVIEYYPGKRFPADGISKYLWSIFGSVGWVGSWPGITSFTQASWAPVEPNATGLPSAYTLHPHRIADHWNNTTSPKHTQISRHI